MKLIDEWTENMQHPIAIREIGKEGYVIFDLSEAKDDIDHDVAALVVRFDDIITIGKTIGYYISMPLERSKTDGKPQPT